MAAKDADPETVRQNARARQRRYYEMNREKIREYHRNRFATDEAKESRRLYIEANREKISAQLKARYEEEAQERNARTYAKLRSDADKWGRSLERRKHLRTGISETHFQDLLAIQSGACAVCERPFESGKNAHRDHCHETKTPRGLLCHNCNTIEGMIKKMDLPPDEFSVRLSAYLESPPFKVLEKDD